MARRSPLNARYQKNTSPAGKTRRSASAAKPKRDAGGRDEGGNGRSEKKGAKRPTLREAWRSVPTTPEMRKWRKVWFVLIGVALVAAVLVGFVPGLKDNPTATAIGSVVYIAALGSAIYIDLMVIRKLRAKAMAEQKAGKQK